MSIEGNGAVAKWLLVYNCQTLGLANCLNLISSSIIVDYCDFPRFKKDHAQYLEKLDSYDLILTAPQFERTEFGDLSRLNNCKLFPTVFFDGYHPDVCYVNAGPSLLKTPLGDYHSALAFSAYKRGLDAVATRKVFCASIYQALGYFDVWENSKRALIGSFKANGMDISADFQRWSASSNFMYSFNHPNIRCLHDIARALVRSQGVAEEFVDTLPHDNLLNGPIFPIYDEIAERYSIKGSYRFKLAGKYRQMSLDEYIRACFDIYDTHEPSTLTIHPLHRKLHEKITAII